MRATLILLLVAGLAGWALSSRPGCAGPEDQLLNRNWIDRLPENDRERLFVYRFVPDMGGGVFQDRTLFKGTFELFKFRHDAETITFDLKHTREKVTTRYRIETVSDGGPFELKLTLERDPRGPRVYYALARSADVGLDEALDVNESAMTSTANAK